VNRVLTLPFRLRYALALNHNLCRAALAIFVHALLAFEKRRAQANGVVGAYSQASPPWTRTPARRNWR